MAMKFIPLILALGQAFTLRPVIKRAVASKLSALLSVETGKSPIDPAVFARYANLPTPADKFQAE